MRHKRDKAMSNIGFRMMALYFKARDLFRNPLTILQKVDIRDGQTILDFGCGPGSYTIPVARLVGESGKVYALDIHPLAAKTIAKKAKKEGLNNVTTIISDRDTGLPDGNVDVTLLFDTIHSIEDKQSLLAELHRVMKPKGLLSILVDHMKVEDVIELVEEDGRFSLREQDGNLMNFERL